MPAVLMKCWSNYSIKLKEDQKWSYFVWLFARVYEGLIDDLAKVQTRAARFVTRNYTYKKVVSSMTDILTKTKTGILAEKKEG